MKCNMSGCQSAFSIVFHYSLCVIHLAVSAVFLHGTLETESLQDTPPLYARSMSGPAWSMLRLTVALRHPDSQITRNKSRFHCFHHSIPEDRKVAMQDHTSPLHIIHLPIVSHSQSLYESYTVASQIIHSQSWYTHVWLLYITAMYSYHTYHHDFTGYPTAGVG